MKGTDYANGESCNSKSPIVGQKRKAEFSIEALLAEAEDFHDLMGESFQTKPQKASKVKFANSSESIPKFGREPSMSPQSRETDDYPDNTIFQKLEPPITFEEFKEEKYKLMISFSEELKKEKELKRFKFWRIDDEEENKLLDDNCPICLGNYKRKQMIRKLHCHHFFHKGCIDKWFENKKQCPSCKSCCKN